MKPASEVALKLYDCVRSGHLECVVEAIEAARREGEAVGFTKGAEEMRERTAAEFDHNNGPYFAVASTIRALPTEPSDG